MVPGTLRDQVTYPDHCGPEVDAKLDKLMSLVEASYLSTRWEKGWDAVQDWVRLMRNDEEYCYLKYIHLYVLR